MAIDGQSIAQIKAEVTASNTTEASFRSGMDHVINAVDFGSFPQGTKLVFYQASAPTGWTKVTTHNDKALRVVSGNGGGSGGSAAFSSAFSHTHTDSFSVDGHGLTEPQMPIHSHVMQTRASYTTNNNIFPNEDRIYSSEVRYSTQIPSTLSTATAGSGSTHNHGLSGSVSSQTISPSYVDVIICSKD